MDFARHTHRPHRSGGGRAVAMTAKVRLTDAGRVRLGGLLGDALAASHAGRLHHFIVDENSPATALFAADRARRNWEGNWYGGHAGKWRLAAARAAAGRGDLALAANVRGVADYLVDVQGADGYLGTYAPARRFTVPQPPGPRTWDGAPGQRTW